MKITPLFDTFFTRCCRSGGGLAFGFHLHFPVRIWDGPYKDPDYPDNHIPTNTTYDSVYCEVGFIFWQLRFSVDYNHKPIE